MFNPTHLPSFFSQWLLELMVFFWYSENDNPQLSGEVVSFLQIDKKTKHKEEIRKTVLEDCHITFFPLQTTDTGPS
jgi:hypothetical protein